ncbi:MAG: T9SS type A sorting domain-containing protein [Bacteroidales bacterium]|nr:T9SS type A sorting domain-containing protein [Bacteroidales bacterium]
MLKAGETVTGFTVSASYNVDLRGGDVPIEEMQKNTVTAYPNPTTGIVNVNKASKIKVYNLQGTLLHKTFGTQVDLSAFPSGVYQLHVNGEVLKVVKQ